MIQQDRDATRDSLRQIRFNAADTHAGLWFDRFVRSQQRSDVDSRRDVVAEAARASVPVAYQQFFLRWYDALTPQIHSDPTVPKLAFARVDGRLAVGLGTEAAIETSIALHRAYGVPYIPGSALKGLAAAYVRQYLSEADWNPKSKAYRILFGTTAAAGFVTFFDALYVPGTGSSENGLPLAPDVMTVHHPDYYQGNKPPADWDSPNPVPFLSATGVYLIALAGPPAWVAFAYSVVADALRMLGVGAKTSNGYGRMTILAENDATSLIRQISLLRSNQTNQTTLSIPKLPRAENEKPLLMPQLQRAEDQQTNDDSQNADTLAQMKQPVGIEEQSKLKAQPTQEGSVVGVNLQSGEAGVLIGGKGMQPRPRIAAALRSSIKPQQRVKMRLLADGSWEIFEIIS
jgi:CRISPR-associated protein Cmr6